jgi:hypothetical protein
MAADVLAFLFNHGADGGPALGVIVLVAVWVSVGIRAQKELRKVIE